MNRDETLSERLRTKMSYVNCGKESRALFRESAVTIDALVAALEKARDELERLSTHGGYGTYAGVDEQINAALALATA